MPLTLKTVQAIVTAGFLGLVGNVGAGINLPVPYMAQPDNQTCFPTTFMMALDFMGRIDDFSSGTVQDLHKYCQYNRFNAPEIARQYGLYALPSWHNLGWTRETVKHELDMGRPVILGVNHGRAGHFVLAVGYTDDGRVIINNPTAESHSPKMGGDHRVVEWKDLLWRGGVILRPDPFPEAPSLSGVAIGEDGYPLERTVNLRLTSGEDAEVSFTLVNNGREAWPEKLFLSPVDPDSSPTRALESVMAEHWLSADRVTEALSSLEPATTRVISFRVKAPDVSKTTTVLEYYNLVDGDGNWFGRNWLAGPGHRNMGVRMIVLPKDRPVQALPLIGNAEAGKPGLPWESRFGKVEIVDSFTTAPPGPGPVAQLYTPGQNSDTAWLGSPDWTDYRIEAWVWCEVRDREKAGGWERVGLFARDNGQHAADTKNEVEIGHCLAMAFDSDDGSVRAGNIFNGGIEDYRDKRLRLKESGWHQFAISCEGSTVSYELDDKPFHVEKNVRQFVEGDCGVFYNGAFKAEPVPESGGKGSRGVVFSGVKVTAP